MAYVRVTEKLIDGIKSKIRVMSDKAVQMHAAPDQSYGTAIHSEVEKAIVSQAWSARPELFGEIPDDWCYYTTSITAEIISQDGAKRAAFEVSTPDTRSLRLPCKPSTYYHDFIAVRYEHQSDMIREWLEDNFRRAQDVSNTREQFRVVQQQITDFLRTKTSLNAALKDMPELELYVPDEFMVKYHAPTERRTGAPAEDQPTAVEVDRDQLTALAVVHRMATAAE